MGVRNKKREVLRRLDSKMLDAKFIHELQHGLNCSTFEAEAVLERRATVEVCQNSKKKWGLHANTLLFLCLARRGGLNLPDSC